MIAIIKELPVDESEAYERAERWGLTEKVSNYIRIRISPPCSGTRVPAPFL